MSKLDRITESIQLFLVKIKVIKTNGVCYDGKPSLNGANMKNPITYLVLPFVILITVIEAIIFSLRQCYNELKR